MIPAWALPWLIRAAVILVVATGAYFKGRSDVNRAWTLERVDAANRALEARAALEAEYRAREAKQAETTRDLETKHAEELQAINDGRADFERRLTERLRSSARGVNNCRVPSAAASPSVPESAVGAADGGLGRVDPEAVSRVREIGKQTQAALRACREWVNSVAR